MLEGFLVGANGTIVGLLLVGTGVGTDVGCLVVGVRVVGRLVGNSARNNDDGDVSNVQLRTTWHRAAFGARKPPHMTGSIVLVKSHCGEQSDDGPPLLSLCKLLRAPSNVVLSDVRNGERLGAVVPSESDKNNGSLSGQPSQWT
jgi:hypothetical protein